MASPQNGCRMFSGFTHADYTQTHDDTLDLDNDYGYYNTLPLQEEEMASSA